MISVTNSARKRLKSILFSKVDLPQAGLRLTITKPGEYGLHVDTEEPGDQVVKHKGTKVLLVEQELASRLDGITLCVEYTPEGPQLAISGDW